ncbi:MAG TPA: hypothetical protein VE944_19610 [Nostoc sp.]|uniref:hypothetical protein n=1 Tax=Nostoc sp. TaxID=1180 RepID=UPI002D414D05|nr:hypothetical protein [Nostoc sp.]HYX16528.1 hypothetical protein [Nostoc sp.]
MHKDYFFFSRHKPDDLDVKVSPEAVEIRGERRFETTIKEKGIRRSEFRYGSFGQIIQ